VDEQPPAPPSVNRRRALWTGRLAGNGVAGVLFVGVGLLVNFSRNQAAGVLIAPSIFLVPFIAGLVAAWCWRCLDLRIGQCLLHSLSTTLIGCGAAAIFLGEGAVCLVIAFPVLYVMILAGALVGRMWFRPKDSGLQISILPVLALLTAGEAFYREDQTAVVTDEILIRARPDHVWPHVLTFPEIPDRPDYWIFRLGLPYPTSTTNGGDFVGADRQCIFSDGIVIKERVAEFAPNEKLTFEIVEQPTHPEAYGHITLHRGQFVLRDNRDGTTTLIGSSWYTLHVRPLWYFDLWTRDLTRAVHLRVMKHVKRLAES
jgi:hypothetical protein